MINVSSQISLICVGLNKLKFVWLSLLGVLSGIYRVLSQYFVKVKVAISLITGMFVTIANNLYLGISSISSKAGRPCSIFPSKLHVIVFAA